VFAAALSAIPAVAIARDGMGFGALPEIFGMSWLDASELLSEALLMPLCTVLMALALSGARGEALLRRQLGKWGSLASGICLKISPLLLAAVAAYKLFGI